VTNQNFDGDFPGIFFDAHGLAACLYGRGDAAACLPARASDHPQRQTRMNTGSSMEGGIGHTIRVCRNEGVPVVFQNDWRTWKI